MTSAQLQALSEQLASDVFERLRLGRECGISQGEETLTDIFLLDLARLGAPSVRVRKMRRDEESRNGMDWEMWLRATSAGWVRYAIQAKRHTRAGTYADLNHRVRGQRQIDLLDGFCRTEGAIGAYCLYNSMEHAIDMSEWHCPVLPLVDAYLGCSIVPLPVIARAIATRGGRTFGAIHQDVNALPFRCLFHDHGTGLGAPVFKPMDGLSDAPIRVYSELPAYVASAEEIVSAPPDAYPIGMAPRLVVVVDAIA